MEPGMCVWLQLNFFSRPPATHTRVPSFTKDALCSYSRSGTSQWQAQSYSKLVTFLGKVSNLGKKIWVLMDQTRERVTFKCKILTQIIVLVINLCYNSFLSIGLIMSLSYAGRRSQGTNILILATELHSWSVCENTNGFGYKFRLLVQV